MDTSYYSRAISLGFSVVVPIKSLKIHSKAWNQKTYFQHFMLRKQIMKDVYKNEALSRFVVVSVRLKYMNES